MLDNFCIAISCMVAEVVSWYQEFCLWLQGLLMTQGNQPTSAGLAATSTNPNWKFWHCDHGLYHWFAWHNSKHALMVCCNKLGKLNHLIPSRVWGTQLSTSEVAKLFFASWVWYDGVPKWLAHNHDVHFTAIFWCVLWAMLGMQTLFSSAYHP